MGSAILTVENLSKSFAGAPAVDNLSFALDEGQILCLLGPSGCGKTTLLRLIAGLEIAGRGHIWFDGQDIAPVPPYQRDFGLMFQEFALFPHKNVGQNVAFGLQMKQSAEVDTRVAQMLELVGLTGFERRDVSILSGGERQRVALARSLAPNPRLLMLDEPLGALDRALRERLMLEIRQILKTVGLTAVYVTHDQTEAFAVADRVIVMNRGQIEQESSPEQIFHRPATPFVARFLGFSNLLPAISAGRGTIKMPLGIWPVPGAQKYPAGKKVTLLVRPEAASVEPVDGAMTVAGTLTSRLFRGRFYQVSVSTPAGPTLTFEMPSTVLPPVGESVTLWLNPGAMQLFVSQE